MRLVVVFLLSLWGFAPAALAKTGPQRFAAIAVVENTGEILHARYIDALRHPASLTKVMTLYLVFEAIKRGDLGWDDRLPVSEKAAQTHPTRLGLRAGNTINVEVAVRALVTKSANDAAIVLAERLGGSEAGFAKHMTVRAQKLGMTGSHFVNASGLPDARQWTTVRDMALLSYRIRHDFPAEFRYFSLPKMVWKGHVIRNHNTLLGHVAGVDGLKTGFTTGSGYNIAVTARRDNTRLIVVVFGGASAARRDAYAARLLDRAFAVLKARRRGKAKPPQALVADMDDRTPVQMAGLPGDVAEGGTEQRGVRIVIDDSVKARPLPDLPPVAKAPERAPAPAGRWAVQVGAYATPEQARTRLMHINAIPVDALADNPGRIALGEGQGATIYRVRFTGLSQAGARQVCTRLKAASEACFAVPPRIATALSE